MRNSILTSQHLVSFREYLAREEKSVATIEKYLRDVEMFLKYGKRPIIARLVSHPSI